MTTYEPGTVAVATVRGVPNVRVMRCGRVNQFWWTPEFAGDSDGNEPQWRMHPDHQVTDIRPLVVLDLGPGNTPARDAVKHLRDAEDGSRSGAGFFGWLADQIEAQTKPPRIPEPGLWGVVEDKHGTQFVHIDPTTAPGTYSWQTLGEPSHHGNCYVPWDEIVEPREIRPGVDR